MEIINCFNFLADFKKACSILEKMWRKLRQQIVFNIFCKLPVGSGFRSKKDPDPYNTPQTVNNVK